MARDEPPCAPATVQQQPHPPIVIGGCSDPMLRAIARYGDKASPMIDVAEAIAKVEARCREIGRDPAGDHLDRRRQPLSPR